MARTARWVLLALLTVVLVLGAAMWLVESAWARGWLENRISQRLDGRRVEIGELDIGWGWPLSVRLEDVSVANPDWAPHGQMLDLTALELAVDPGALLQGRVELERLHLQRPEIHLARREDGTTSWAGLTDDGAGDGGGVGVSPVLFSIEQGRLTYQDPTLDAELSVDFHTREEGSDSPQLVIGAQGTFQGRPLELKGQGGAPGQALAQEPGAYPMHLQGRLGEVQASFDGHLRDVTQPTSVQGALTINAPQEANLAALLERPAVDLPAIDLQGQISHADRRWSIQQLDARLGESRLTGSLSVTLDERPRIEAQLEADRLDLERWGITNLNEPDAREQAEQAVEQAVEQAGEEMAWDWRWAERLATLRAFEAKVDLAIGQLSYGDHTLHDVALDGRLAEGRLDVARLHAAQDGGELTLQGWLEVHAETLSGDFDAQLTAVDLDEALGPLGFENLGTLEGRLQAHFDDGALTLDDTLLDYRAPALALVLHVEAEAADLAGTSDAGVHLRGNGSYRGDPFEYDLRVGPLLNLDDPDTPYPVQGQVSSRDSLLRVDGTIEQPLAISAVQGTFELSGPNPARLNRLTGLNLPALPPYSLQGELQVRDDLVRLLDLTGRVGNSDASGDVRLRLGERNMLWATLHSQRLDLDDLAPLIGAAPETGEGEVASPDQQRQAREEERQSGVFPEREWNVQGLHRMDAEVIYSAANVSAENIPLTEVELDLTLEHGVLTLAPLRVGVGGGEALAQLRLDAQGDALQGNLELSLSQVNLKPLLQRAGLSEIAEDSAGTLGGEGQVSFQGSSLAAVMAGLEGNLALAMSGGQLDMLLVEAVGLDVGEALLGALADADEVPMQCAYARLEAESGLSTLERFFIATADSNITGTGTINLADEQLELIFEAHPKDPSLPASDSPVRLQGTLDDLGINIVSRELVARGVLSALGALVAPPLAILPWIETGTGEDMGSDCRQVMNELDAGEVQG